VTVVKNRLVRLLILDQSPATRERLRRLFDDVPDIDVVGEAGTIDKALRLLDEVTPTAVLTGCELPEPGSFAAVKAMMTLHPVPVVMVTKEAKASASVLDVQALEAGAVALVSWTRGDPNAAKESDGQLVRTVRAMSEVKVVRRRGQRAHEDAPSSTAIPTLILQPPGGRVDIVAIGASTGGPPVLQTILAGLSRPFPVPIVLVQHMSPGFQGSLVKWLSESTGVRLCVAEHGMPLDPGVVYLAPDNKHMTLDSGGRMVLNNDPSENGSRPSVSVLFRSVAQHYGPRAIGILLTGMGRDGAKELRLMRDRGAVTIAQDEETSVVHGMPGEAIKLKGARYVLSPDRVAYVVEHHVLAASNTSVKTSAATCR
jgi:two-component system, chemotaxis family, protein-glutamate methylesterase/glutaminase